MTLLISSEEENHGQVRVTLEFYSTNNLKYSMSMQKEKKDAEKKKDAKKNNTFVKQL